jgi:HEAT repeat protein
MALGNPKNQNELAELVAALGDENNNIRWLAGSALVRLRGQGIRPLLTAYLATEPGEPGQSEAQRVMNMIEEVSE